MQLHFFLTKTQKIRSLIVKLVNDFDVSFIIETIEGVGLSSYPFRFLNLLQINMLQIQ